MTVTLGDQKYDHLPRLGFYVTTCVAMKWNTDGGETIGIRLTPTGVARLFDLDATLYRDPIVHLDQLVAPEVCSAMFESLRNSDQGPAVKGNLHRFLLVHMAKPHRQETEILALTELLLDNSVETVAEASDLLSLPIHTLRRISLRYFGFPARTLMIRSRFLRSLLMMKEDTAKNRQSVIDGSYTRPRISCAIANGFWGWRRYSSLPSRPHIWTLYCGRGAWSWVPPLRLFRR
jgi:hypothetical protein